MKHYFLLIVILFLGTSTYNNGMESPRTLDVREIFTDAFKHFGLSAEEYSVNIYHPNTELPAEVERWNVTDTHIEITKDIRKNKDLTEFAAFCAAAYVKNNGPFKKALTCWGTYGASVAAPMATMILSKQQPYSCYWVSLALLPALALVLPLNLPNKLFERVNDYLARQAFTHACKKLIELKKFQPLATYYAFAQQVKHAPLDKETQTTLMLNIIRANQLSIEYKTSPGISTIINESDSQNPIRLASGSYTTTS